MVKHALPLLLALTACSSDPCPYGSMLDNQGGLLVTQGEHPTGWGQAECVACHAMPQLHQQACTPGIDYDTLREDVLAMGPDACMDCHGTNGTEVSE